MKSTIMFSRTQVTNDDWGLVGSRQTVSVGLRSAVAESQPSIIHSTPDLRRSCLSSHAFACSGSQSIGPTPTVRKEDARMAQVLLPNTASGTSQSLVDVRSPPYRCKLDDGSVSCRRLSCTARSGNVIRFWGLRFQLHNPVYTIDYSSKRYESYIELYIVRA
jgi:hypothetical protein